MANKYFKPSAVCSLVEIAEFCGGVLKGRPKPHEVEITDVLGLSEAHENSISFLSNPKYAKFVASTKAVAVILSSEDASKIESLIAHSGEGPALVVVPDPYIAFAKVLNLFYPYKQPYPEYRDPSVRVHPSAQVGSGCYLSSGVVIGENVTIEDNVYLGPNTVIATCATVGAGTIIHSSVSIKYAEIGKNCIIHDGARIGQDGFGFAPNYKERHVKIPQVGLVMIGDEVEIGANTCIDRGALNNTVIGAGTKIDNLVQIGHNVRIGENCFMGGQSGVSGSTVIENNVAIAGQSGISPHIRLGEGAQLAPKSGVLRSVEPHQAVLGSPARPINEALRLEAILNKMIKKSKRT